MAENALAQKVVPKLLTQLFRWLLPAKDVPADSKLPDTGLKAVFIYLKAVFIYLKAGFIYCFPWVCLVIRLVSILSEDSDDQYRGEAKLGRQVSTPLSSISGISDSLSSPERDSIFLYNLRAGLFSWSPQSRCPFSARLLPRNT